MSVYLAWGQCPPSEDCPRKPGTSGHPNLDSKMIISGCVSRPPPHNHWRYVILLGPATENDQHKLWENLPLKQKSLQLFCSVWDLCMIDFQTHIGKWSVIELKCCINVQTVPAVTVYTAILSFFFLIKCFFQPVMLLLWRLNLKHYSATNGPLVSAILCCCWI